MVETVVQAEPFILRRLGYTYDNSHWWKNNKISNTPRMDAMTTLVRIWKTMPDHFRMTTELRGDKWIVAINCIWHNVAYLQWAESPHLTWAYAIVTGRLLEEMEINSN
jgi:hypothetical protein